jgi:hypothetical protein
MKAQIQGQIFIYILSVVVVTLVLMYGYRAIRGFNQQAQMIDILEFKTTLQNEIDGIRSDWGSVKTLQIKVPNDYKEVCFVDLNKGGIINASYPLIADSVNSGVKQNLFLVRNLGEESFYLGNITLAGPANMVCKSSVQGKTQVILAGRGDHVEIS